MDIEELIGDIFRLGQEQASQTELIYSKKIQRLDRIFSELGSLKTEITTHVRCVEKECEELRAKLAAMESQTPVAWVTDDHLTDKSATTYSKEVAARWVKKGWPVDYLYKKPVPADKPARITEQDAHDKNSQRYLWVKENIQEEPTQESLRDSEYAEHKTCYKLPLLIAWADFCGHISLDDAIDNQISRGDRCPSHESEGE